MLARVLLLFGVVIWGWSFVATKVCLGYIGPVEVVGMRLLIALPVMLAVVAIKKVPLRFEKGDWWGLSLGGLILTIHFLIQVTGIKYTSATNTGWIISITPLVMAVLAVFLLREKLTRNTILGIVVATIGVLLLMSRGDVGNLDWISSAGDWLVLVSAHTWALYTVAVRNVTKRRPPLAVTLVVLLPCTVVCAMYMAIESSWTQIAAMPLDGWVAMLFLGVLAMALAHWFWQEGVASIGAARAGTFLYLEPIATTALAVPYLGESFGLPAAVGAAMVLGGLWWSERRPRRGLQ